MSRLWTTVLLVSVGLNLGLGFRLLRPGHPLAVPDGQPTTSVDVEADWQNPAPSDSTAWNHYLGRRMRHLTARLELSPAQVEGFRAAQAGHGRLLRQKRRDLLGGRQELRALLAAGEVDRSVLRQAMADLGRCQAELDSLSAETLLRELEVLDPGQRAEYLDLLPAEPGSHKGAGRRGRQRRGG